MRRRARTRLRESPLEPADASAGCGQAPAAAVLAARRRAAGRAFTLVETVVALAISSLLVVSVVSTTRALSGSRDSAERRVERSASARRAMETIVAGLRNVRRDPIRLKPVVVGRSEGGNQGNDGIDLLVINDQRCREEGAESDQYEMSFYLRKRPGSKCPALMCRKDHAFDDYPDQGGIETVVAEGIISLSFEYLLGREWRREWSALEERTPDAVRVTVVAGQDESRGETAGGGVTVLSTVVALGVNAAPTEQPENTPVENESGGPRR